MVQAIPATDIDLAQLKNTFGLERSYDPQFFLEWQEGLPELNDLEKQALDEVKAEYLHLSTYEILEPVVKMVVLSPLLKLAGFYRPPFYMVSEKVVELCSLDGETIISGRIDILIFKPEFWIVAIEAKRARYSVMAGIPQLLAYMLASSNASRPVYGLVATGQEFSFLKLTIGKQPRYTQSHLFSIDRQDDLYTVARILKHLAQLAGESSI
jgi:hypothetical protein